MSKAQIKWVQNYLLPMKAAGLIEPEEERRQWVFHIMVSDRYTGWRDWSEVAQRQMDELPVSDVRAMVPQLQAAAPAPPQVSAPLALTPQVLTPQESLTPPALGLAQPSALASGSLDGR